MYKTFTEYHKDKSEALYTLTSEKLLPLCILQRKKLYDQWHIWKFDQVLNPANNKQKRKKLTINEDCTLF